jgi:hypothetical protein
MAQGIQGLDLGKSRCAIHDAMRLARQGGFVKDSRLERAGLAPPRTGAGNPRCVTSRLNLRNDPVRHSHFEGTVCQEAAGGDRRWAFDGISKGRCARLAGSGYGLLSERTVV